MDELSAQVLDTVPEKKKNNINDPIVNKMTTKDFYLKPSHQVVPNSQEEEVSDSINMVQSWFLDQVDLCISSK